MVATSSWSWFSLLYYSPGKEEERYGRKATDLSNTEFEGSDAYAKESEGEEEKEPPPLQPQSYEPSQVTSVTVVHYVSLSLSSFLLLYIFLFLPPFLPLIISIKSCLIVCLSLL